MKNQIDVYTFIYNCVFKFRKLCRYMNMSAWLFYFSKQGFIHQSINVNL